MSTTTADIGAHLPPGRTGPRQVLRMEAIKLRSLRSTRWTAALTVAGVLGIGLAVLGSYSAKHFQTMSAQDLAAFDPVNMSLAGMALALLTMPVLGALVMCSEYSSGLIRTTFAAVPNRRLVLLAKAAVFGAATLLVGEIVAFAVVVGGEALLTPAAPHLTLSQPGVLRTTVLSGAYLAVLGLMGLGIGAIVRHTAPTVAVVVGLFFVLPTILAVAGRGVAESVGRFLPLFIAENSVGAVKPVAHALSPWVGFGMGCLYAAVLLGTGGWLLTRRDA